jgi:hypothetical protein
MRRLILLLLVIFFLSFNYGYPSNFKSGEYIFKKKTLMTEGTNMVEVVIEGGLNIKMLNQNKFKFELNTVNTRNYAVCNVEGIAKLVADNKAVFKDSQFNCVIEFVVKGNDIEVKPNENCTAYCGMSAEFDGLYVNASNVNASDMNIPIVNASNTNASKFDGLYVNASNVNASDTNISIVNASNTNASNTNASTKRSEKNGLPDWVFLLIIGGGYIAIKVLIIGYNTRCPSCKKWWAGKLIDREEIDVQEGYKTVVRNYPVRNKRGRIIGYVERPERVHVVYVTYLNYYKCKYCRYEWTTISTSEYIYD